MSYILEGNNSGIRVFFIHSSLQLSIAKRLVKGNKDKIFIHRGARIIDSNSVEVIGVSSEFILSSVDFSLYFIKLIRDENIIEVVIPHSHQINLIFSLAIMDNNIKKISYLEDGAGTWRYLSKNKGKYCKKDITCKSFKFLKVLIFFYRIVILNKIIPITIKRRIFTKLHKTLHYFNNISIYESRVKKGGFYVSFPTVHDCIATVDISTDCTNIDTKLKNTDVFFLSPRYLLTDNDNLVKCIKGVMRNNRLVIVAHPTFWKKEKKERIDKFILALKSKEVEHDFYSIRVSDEDITFELYLRGCRSFISIDSTIHVTVDYYKAFFSGLHVACLQSVIYNKSELEDSFNYVSGVKKY
jgi:hypothetical protein